MPEYVTVATVEEIPRGQDEPSRSKGSGSRSTMSRGRFTPSTIPAPMREGRWAKAI